MSGHGHSTTNAHDPTGNKPAESRVIDPQPYICPVCGQEGLTRIRRRLIDRILSLIVRQRRFRCTQPGCQWQGNLRAKNRDCDSK